MLERAREAAVLWGLGGADIALAAERENVVFRVDTGEGSYALRFHRKGYRSEAELQSELDWLAALADGGLHVPKPMPSKARTLVQEFDGHHIDLLTWLDGAPLGAAGELKGVDDRVGFCRLLGHQMAQLHELSDAWARPLGFTRPHWDRAGLVGDAPLWGCFWEHPHLSDEARSLLLNVRRKADALLAEREADADYGLIHADLLSENMLWDGRRIAFIDFDDGGFGFREFELATFLLRYRGAEDYAELKGALCEGYAARRSVDDDMLALMLVSRALTYVGWIKDRLGEPNASERSARAITTALELARDFMEG